MEGWTEGERCIEQQKLPMLASQCGYVMRARDTDTHSGLNMAPWLINGTQRPQTEVAEHTQ